jgi:serine/threonine protein kinase
VDTFQGRVGFWSDFVYGRTLSSLLGVQGRFGATETALIGIDLCKAVNAVHAAGLLHRDIKTGNVMREEGGRILLMDFGLTRETSEAHSIAGTPSYMAPELFKGSAATVESDIYALGVLL